MKHIKIPKGEIHLILEGYGGRGFELTDEILWNALNNYVFKEPEPKNELSVFGHKKESTYENNYDDENPDYIKSSQEEI